jgi:hypothetical protein
MHTETESPDCGCDDMSMYSQEQCMDCPKRHFCDVTKQPQNYIEAETQSTSSANSDYETAQRLATEYMSSIGSVVPSLSGFLFWCEERLHSAKKHAWLRVWRLSRQTECRSIKGEDRRKMIEEFEEFQRSQFGDAQRTSISERLKNGLRSFKNSIIMCSDSNVYEEVELPSGKYIKKER